MTTDKDKRPWPPWKQYGLAVAASILCITFIVFTGTSLVLDPASLIQLN